MPHAQPITTCGHPNISRSRLIALAIGDPQDDVAMADSRRAPAYEILASKLTSDLSPQECLRREHDPLLVLGDHYSGGAVVGDVEWVAVYRWPSDVDRTGRRRHGRI